MSLRTSLIIAGLFLAYSFAIWKWSESHYRSNLLENHGVRDTTTTTDTGKVPLAPVRDSIDVRPIPAPVTIHDTIPDVASLEELRAIIARKDSILGWQAAAFSQSITEFGHTIFLSYRPELRKLYYDWVPPRPVTTTQTITETKYLPAVEPPLWVDLHLGEHGARLAGGVSIGWGPLGVTRIVAPGEKPTTMATFHQRFSLPSLFGFSAPR